MCLLVNICYFKIHFHQLGLFKLIKTMLKSLNVLLGLSPALSKGYSQYLGYLAFNYHV